MTLRLLVLVCAAAAALAGPATAPAADHAPIPVTLGAGSVLWLEGTSTMHDYESRSKEVTIALAGDPGVAPPADAAALFALIRASGVRTVHVRVPVQSLRSKKEALDKNLRKAMRADEFPAVEFTLGDYAPGATAGDTLTLDSKGTLTIAGVERPVTLEARVHLADGGVWLEGSEALRMSEYGIKPPTMMLGTLKVHDPITVRYRLLLVPGAAVHSDK